MRRLFFGLLGTLLFFPLSMISVLAAQEATPASAFADLGLPTLDVTITEDTYEGIPDSLEAGRYLVTVTVSEDAGESGGAGVGFIQPAGMTGEEFIAFLGELSGPPSESGVGSIDSTPIAGAVASPADEGGEMGGPPPVVFESRYAGGITATPGQPAQIVLDLTPGEWVAWGDDPTSPLKPVVFDVTGEMPAELPEPESSATLTMGEYVIEVTEGEMTSGRQVLEVVHIGAQPHFIFAAPGPDDMTDAQIATVLEEDAAAETTGTPPAYSGLNPNEDLGEGFATGTQSTGVTTWIEVDLEPSPYVFICFYPDISDGMPHAFHGMYNVIEVAE
jgi:hypothetical protein